MAEIVARVYRDPRGFLAVVDGWGAFRGRTLRETVQVTRSALEEVVAGAFPDRPGIDPQGAELVVHFRLRLRPVLPDRRNSPFGPDILTEDKPPTLDQSDSDRRD